MSENMQQEFPAYYTALCARVADAIADILAANQLEQESEIPCERLLLIPKKRA